MVHLDFWSAVPCGPFYFLECTPMWSAKLFGVHSHLVIIAFKNALRSGPPYTLSIKLRDERKFFATSCFETLYRTFEHKNFLTKFVAQRLAKFGFELGDVITRLFSQTFLSRLKPRLNNKRMLNHG